MTSVKRRLAAIVAADVVGYSRLMGAYEEETITQLRAHRAEVFEAKLPQYHGRIANTAGDSFLLEFASAVDALRYAIDVQAEMARRNQSVDPDKQLVFRIGINVGDVVANGEDLLGDGVNVAARIEALAEPGEICISRSARDQVRDRIDITLDDLGEVEVKNIARPVRVFRVLSGSGSGNGSGKTATSPAAGSAAKSGSKVVLATIAAMVIAGAAAFWWYQQSSTLPPEQINASTPRSDGPSIAVLPFSNLSGKQSESYFADGITEDITIDLSNVSGLNVTSSSSAKRLQRGQGDVAASALKLGIGHLIEGSVRRSEDRIRITAKLIDVASGNQLWAERFDRKPEDIFAIQDEITGRVVSQLSDLFTDINFKTKRRSYTPNPLAYDYYIKGRAQRIPPTPGNLKAAFESFNKAIEIDPKFAGGYAGASIATILASSDSTKTPETAKAGLAEAQRLAQKAVELDPDFGPGWGSLAEAYLRTGQHDESLQAIEKAIQAAPGDSLMRANFGRYLGYVGRAQEGIKQVRQAMRMSPDSLPLLYFLGLNQRSAGQFDAAVESLIEHRKRLSGRILPAPTTQLIAAYVEAGHVDKARETVALLLKAAPKFSARKAAKIHLYKDVKEQQAFGDALRTAGLPD